MEIKNIGEFIAGILLIVSITMVLLSLVNIFLDLNTHHGEIKEVKCYDKFSNEIIGQTCKEEYSPAVLPYFISLTIIAMLFMFTILFNILND